MPEPTRPAKSAAKASSAPRAAAPKLPPRVVKKKESTKRKSVVEKPPTAPSDPIELLVPIILIVVGVGALIGTSILLRPEAIPLGLWLGLRMGIALVSMVITYGALFLAAMVVETDYGYISTGIPKVAAIVLTQDWVGDLASEIPVPYVGGIIAFIVTYTMFKVLFGLDDREAIASMFVVRLVHWLVFAFAFIAIVAAAMGGHAIDLSAPLDAVAPPDRDAAPAGADDGDEDDLDMDDFNPNAGAGNFNNFNNPNNPNNFNPNAPGPAAPNPDGNPPQQQ